MRRKLYILKTTTITTTSYPINPCPFPWLTTLGVIVHAHVASWESLKTKAQGESWRNNHYNTINVSQSLQFHLECKTQTNSGVWFRRSTPLLNTLTRICTRQVLIREPSLWLVMVVSHYHKHKHKHKHNPFVSVNDLQVVPNLGSQQAISTRTYTYPPWINAKLVGVCLNKGFLPQASHLSSSNLPKVKITLRLKHFLHSQELSPSRASYLGMPFHNWPTQALA